MTRRAFFSLALVPLIPITRLSPAETAACPGLWYVEDTITGIRMRFVSVDHFTRPGRTISVELLPHIPRVEECFNRSSADSRTF